MLLNFQISMLPPPATVYIIICNYVLHSYVGIYYYIILRRSFHSRPRSNNGRFDSFFFGNNISLSRINLQSCYTIPM